MSSQLRFCWRGGYIFILVRIGVCSVVLGKILALVVRIIVRVFLQMYMVFIEKRKRVDDWRLLVCVFVGIVGYFWDVVGGV